MTEPASPARRVEVARRATVVVHDAIRGVWPGAAEPAILVVA